jgi:hypothetical protein
MLSDPTGLIKDFHEEFDTIPEAKKYVIRHKPPLRGAACFAWDMLGDMASFEGTTLHGYGESLLINGECRRLTWQDTLCGGSTQRDIKICVGENRASSIL